MTYNKVLKRGIRYDGVEIIAYEIYEKYSTTPEYTIDVFKDDNWIFSKACARTTWKRAFNDLFVKGIK